MLINGVKFACNTCVKGHRSSNCNHFDRPLFEIRKKGRPANQCSFCRDLRKTKQAHIKCTCTDKSKKSKSNKSLKIENTATQYYQSNRLSGTNQYHGTYSDGMTQEPIPTSRQCACHETPSKLLLYNNVLSNTMNAEPEMNWQPQDQKQLSTFTRSDGLDEQQYGGHYRPLSAPSMSLQFLNEQIKSPRRRSSVPRRSSINSASSEFSSRRRSTMSHLSRPVISVEDFDLTEKNAERNRTDTYSMTDYQQNINLGMGQQHIISMAAPVYPKSSSASIISSSASIPSSNSPYSDHMDEINLGNYTNNLGIMARDPDELTNLLNNVLMDSNQSPISNQFVEDTTNNTCYQQPQTAADMTGPTTISSPCPSSYATPMISPPQPSWCGSPVSHVNCAPSSPTSNQGESVVITITPLQNTKPAVTRIVTCYCGDLCNCPGCFVHPNNLFAMDYQQQQHEQTQLKNYPLSSFSSSSSSCSSDDEVLYQHPC